MVQVKFAYSRQRALVIAVPVGSHLGKLEWGTLQAKLSSLFFHRSLCLNESAPLAKGGTIQRKIRCYHVNNLQLQEIPLRQEVKVTARAGRFWAEILLFFLFFSFFKS